MDDDVAAPGTRRPGRPSTSRRRRGVLRRSRRPTTEHLVEIHDHLRSELTRLHGLVEEVRRGRADGGGGRARRCTPCRCGRTTGRSAPTASPTAASSTATTRSRTPASSRTCAAPSPRPRPCSTGSQEEHIVIHHLLDDVDRALVGAGPGRRRGCARRRGGIAAGASATGCSATWPTRSASCAARWPATASSEPVRRVAQQTLRSRSSRALQHDLIRAHRGANSFA